MSMTPHLPRVCCTAPARGTFVSGLVGLSPAPRTDAALDTAAAQHQDQQVRAEAGE